MVLGMEGSIREWREERDICLDELTWNQEAVLEG
jgi:hypothetical protein